MSEGGSCSIEGESSKGQVGGKLLHASRKGRDSEEESDKKRTLVTPNTPMASGHNEGPTRKTPERLPKKLGLEEKIPRN